MSDEDMRAAGIGDEQRRPCEIWTRVMGYHRPVADWNIGKRGEHALRKFFTEAKALAERGLHHD